MLTPSRLVPWFDRAMTTMIPLDTAELLHVTLGSLAAVLTEGHPWAGLAQEMLDTYNHQVTELVGVGPLRQSAEVAAGVVLERIELLGMGE